MHLIAIMFLLIAAPGCTYSAGRDFDPAQTSRFKPGVTKYGDAVEALGEPWETIRNTDGTSTAIYKREKGFGILAFTSASHNTVTLKFDANGVLQQMYGSE